MALQYKVDILKQLKEVGYNTSTLRKERIMGEATIQKIRQKKLVSWNNMNKICNMLDCQLSDIIEFKNDKES